LALNIIEMEARADEPLDGGYGNTPKTGLGHTIEFATTEHTTYGRRTDP
jgi:hypothetical protein